MKHYVAIYMVPQRVEVTADNIDAAVRIAQDSATKGDTIDGYVCKLMSLEADPNVRQIHIPPDLPMPPMAA
jgi:hypothetical protein